MHETDFPFARAVRDELDDVLASTEPVGPHNAPAVPDAAAMSATELDGILDELGGDARALSTTTAKIRDTTLEVIRERADARRRARLDRLDGAELTSSTEVRREAVGAADDHDVLKGIADAMLAGAAEARAIAGELLDELPGRGGKARRSLKVADGRGFELTVSNTPRTELAVDVDQLVDVLTAAQLEAHAGTDPEQAGSYARGIRDGVAAFRAVLASSPSFRSTALDSLVKRLEDAEEEELAKRLRSAYRRVEKGSPSVKLDRAPLKGEEGSS